MNYDILKFHVFSDTSWPVLMNIQMSELMMSSPHNRFHIMTKISYLLSKYKTCLITTHNNWEIMFTLIYFDMGIWFYQYELKIKKFRNFIYNTYEKLWGHDIINSLIWIFIRTGEMFPEKMWNFKMSYSLISYPIFIIFALIGNKIK